MGKLKKYFDIEDLAAFATWLLVLIITLRFMFAGSAERQDLIIPIVMTFVAYLISYWLCTRESDELNITYSVRLFFLILQLILVFVLLYLLPFSFLAVLVVIWAAVIAHFFSMAKAMIYMTAAIVAFFSCYYLWWDEKELFSGLLFWCFNFFAIYSHTQIVKERDAKNALQLKHQQLLATQHLLSEASKDNERTRIARDLHDLLGHHLTALTINLQVASRLIEGEAKEKVEQSHSIAKLLLADVRDAVSTLRKSGAFDPLEALDILFSQVPLVEIHFTRPETMNIKRMEVAEVLLRIVQESLTNTLRHTKAKNVWVELSESSKACHLAYTDDGKLASEWQIGNGLKGMDERVSSVSGRLDVFNHNGALKIEVLIPKE